MSPERATLLHCTLGIHERKVISSSVGAALQREHLPYALEVPPLKGLNECVPIINPGLAPWAMKKYRPKGLLFVFPITLLF